MTHGSLFSGIGGFDLAAEWMGWENVFHCEWNDFGKRILKYYWPNAITYDDITKTDFTIHRGQIDILTGGFPCQPYSTGGKRLGKKDDRHLWPEMLRAISEIKPKWIVGENVFGLVNWNNGLVFQEVQTDLEAQGYEVQPFLLPAAGVNAPHQRYRIWFVANAINNGNLRTTRKDERESIKKWLQEWNKIQRTVKSDALFRDIANTKRRKQKKRWNNDRMGWEWKQDEKDTWSKFPTSNIFCNGNDGLSIELDGITFSQWRRETIKAGGNAIVPQLAFQIFKSINKYEEIINKHS